MRALETIYLELGPVFTGAITDSIIQNVYGSSEDFLKSYEIFQRDYIQALSTDLDAAKASGLDVDMLRRGTKIDLSVLRSEARERLSKRYRDDVLRLPKLFNEIGLPNVSLPSSNLYRELFRYQIEAGYDHSAAVLLNRTLLNVDPNKMGYDAFNVGISNLTGARQLKQTSTKSLQELFQGKRVFTFDVETTGVFQGAQTRSMAIAEMSPTGKISLLDETVSFASKQLTGINVGSQTGATRSLTEMLFEGRKITEYGVGGDEFLDAGAKFISRLTEADIVAGHNVLFDIFSLFGTMKNMPGYEKHQAAQKAISAFNDKWSKNEDFVVDTLEYARTYLNQKIQSKIDMSLPNDMQLSRFRDLLFSEDFMSRIHLGGSTATASMEAIAANTNLLQLIEAESKSDDTAKQLMEMLYKGTHIEDTDATLQSYMAKFIQSGQLDVMDTMARSNLSPQVKEIQRVIMASSATTITTNIADINHLTKTARAYIETEEALKGITLRVNDQGMEGILKYNRSEEKFQLTNAGASSDIPDDVAQRMIREAIGGDSKKIMDLGINYMQNHQMDEINNLMVAAAKKADKIEKTAVLNSIGKTYSTLSGSVGFRDAIEISRGRMPAVSSFGIGAENYANINDYNRAMIELANARAAMGNPFYMLDANSLKVSTIMAESTGDYSKNILDKLNNMVQSGQYEGSELEKLRGQIDSLKYVDYKDIIPEVGVSHFLGEKGFRVMQSEGMLREKIFAPLDVMEKAAGDDFLKGRVSLSYAVNKQGQSYMNAVYRASDETTKAQARLMAEKMLDLAEEKASVVGGSKALDQEATKAAHSALEMVTAFRGAKNRDELLDELADKILNRGIVIGSIEGEAAERAHRSLVNVGVDLSNDMAAGRYSARIADTLGDGYGFRLAPLVEDVARRGSGHATRIDEASQEVIRFLNELATSIRENKIDKQLRTQVSRSRLGMTPNSMVDFYLQHKTKIGLGGLGLVAAGAAYYMSKKYRENKIYDETIKAQPTERFARNQGLSDQMELQASISSFRRDPLATAGVVGNLDRNKIGHHRMGNDKYNHLYAGV